MKQLLIILALFPIFCQAQTQQQVLRELHRQKVPHAYIVLAQARLESGNFKSDFYRKTNNLFGLKKGKKYKEYPHWRKSIEDYRLRISKRYQGGCYYKFLQRIGYASDKKYIYKVKKIANEKVCQLRKSSNRIGRFPWVRHNKERKRWQHGIQCKEMQVV